MAQRPPKQGRPPQSVRCELSYVRTDPISIDNIIVRKTIGCGGTKKSLPVKQCPSLRASIPPSSLDHHIESLPRSLESWNRTDVLN